MRLVDAIVRQGHLSERALTESVMTGDRPAHLNRCDICAERALELGRWLDAVRTTAQNETEKEFPAERLAAQQAQIMRRLEQADEPSRVLAFPAPSVTPRGFGQRRVAPVWVGLAAAAGLVLGVVGTQVSNTLVAPAATAVAPPATATPADTAPTESAAPANAAIINWERFDQMTPSPLSAIDEITPTMEVSMR